MLPLGFCFGDDLRLEAADGVELSEGLGADADAALLLLGLLYLLDAQALYIVLLPRLLALLLLYKKLPEGLTSGRLLVSFIVPLIISKAKLFIVYLLNRIAQRISHHFPNF